MKKISLLLTITLFAALSATAATTQFQPTYASLSQHKVPAWFKNAKVGIIIHYGLYSVPAYAPVVSPDRALLTPDNPYVAWYLNTMQIPGSPTAKYQKAHYGNKGYYQTFIPAFIKDERKVNVTRWANLFKHVGAKYVVIVSKHHDGFMLWKPKAPDTGSPYIKKLGLPTYVNLIPKLRKAIKKTGLRFGIYYSGGYDWSWPDDDGSRSVITNFSTMVKKIHETNTAYSAFIYKQYMDLINRFHPAVLWNDIAIPKTFPKNKLLAYYYNHIKGSVINGRWGSNVISDIILAGMNNDFAQALRGLIFHDWYDYYDVEYQSHLAPTIKYFEADRAIGYDFAYNRNEFTKGHRAHLLTVSQLVEYLSDIVAKNGNLLIGIGPEADGKIPTIEKNRLLAFGRWLKKYGQAIYNTRPFWVLPQTTTLANIPVRFTVGNQYHNLFAVIWTDKQHPLNGNHLTIKGLYVPNTPAVCVLDGKNCIQAASTNTANGLMITLPSKLKLNSKLPFAVKIQSSKPQWLHKPLSSMDQLDNFYHSIQSEIPVLKANIEKCQHSIMTNGTAGFAQCFKKLHASRLFNATATKSLIN